MALLSAMLLGLPALTACSDDKGSGGNEGGEDPDEVQTIELDDHFGGMYFGDFYDEGYGQYYTLLCNDELVSLGMGDYACKTEGRYVLYMALWGALSEDPANPIIPEGTYTSYDGHAENTFELEYTWASLTLENTGTQIRRKAILFSSGTIKVTHTETGYDIKAEFETTEGKTISFSYSGDIGLTDYSDDEETDYDIRGDVDLEPARVTCQLYESAPAYDNWLVRLFDIPEITNDGLHAATAGMKLQLDLYTRPGEGLSGEYRVGTFTDGAFNRTPGSFYPGVRLGLVIAGGTHCERVNSDGSLSFCVMDAGTITISENGDGTYAFDIALKTDDGNSVTSRWSGEVEAHTVRNPPQTTLTDDVVFMPDTCLAVTYFGSDTEYGISNFWIELDNTGTGEFMILDLITPLCDGTSLPEGKYVVEETFAPHTILPGEITGGSGMPSFYVQYEKDGPGAADPVAAAPFISGECSISRSGADYTITYTFYDDANREDSSVVCNKISGSWTGTLPEIRPYNPGSLTAIKGQKALHSKMRLRPVQGR